MSKPPRKPHVSPSMRAVIANLKAGRFPGYGLPFTQSHAAGLGCTMTAMVRHGWLTQDYQLTDAGRNL